MGMLVEFRVEGEPLPQPRQRFRGVMIDGKPRARAYRDKSQPIHAFKNAVAANAVQARPPGWPQDAAYRLVALFVRPRPKKAGKGTRETGNRIAPTKPDADNYLKAIKDALKNVLWVDDGRVWASAPVKLIARQGERPHTRILVAVDDTRRQVSPEQILAAWVKTFCPT